MRPPAKRTLKLTGDLRIANASHSLVFDSPAAFCEAAPRVKCRNALAVDSSSIVRSSIEMLLSLLFALDGEAEASAHLGGAMEWRR